MRICDKCQKKIGLKDDWYDTDSKGNPAILCTNCNKKYGESEKVMLEKEKHKPIKRAMYSFFSIIFFVIGIKSVYTATDSLEMSSGFVLLLFSCIIEIIYCIKVLKKSNWKGKKEIAYLIITSLGALVCLAVILKYIFIG